MKPPFLVVMAMRTEANELIEQLEFKQIDKVLGEYLPTIGYRSDLIPERPMYLLLNGVDSATGVDLIGTQMATATALMGIRTFAPCAVFNFGTCGALRSKAKIGDVFICADRVWFHTKRISLPKWDDYSKGGFPCPEVKGIAERLGFKSGVLSTTDSLDHPVYDAQRFDELGADLADMEGAAIAWMAHLHKVPYYGLKAVSNYLNANSENSHDEFYGNLSMVISHLTCGAKSLLIDLSIHEKALR